jgi:LCP family protein required for cell wall assembly
VVCIVAALTGAASLAYAERKVGQIDRTSISSEGFVGGGGLASDEPRNFLIVGADSDDGLSADDPAAAGRGSVGGIRSDTIMVVRLDPTTRQAKVLSFPRDLWVDIPGNSRNRINASLQFGGEDLLISTIKANFDIDINHYVQVDFAGFKQLVELLDGMPIYFATPVRDTRSGLNVQTAGCHRLTPDSALAYVRSRHLLYLDDRGRWVSDPTSDLGRISRQQDFIKRVLTRAIAQGARNPVKLASFVDAGVQNIRLDEDTTPGDLVDLGSAFRNFDPSSLQTFSLPVTDVYRGGALVLELQPSAAEPILALFRGTGEAAGAELSPTTVAVQVLNGSGAQDQAGEATAILATAGFKVDRPNSARGVERTEVRYPPGQEAAAVLVARHLFADPVLVPDLDVRQVTVVTGPDFVAAILEPRPATDIAVPTTTTTTTAPAAEVEVAPEAATTAPPTTTTTTEPTGFVPEEPPPGVTCR